MDALDKAVKRIFGEWPDDPCWIYTTPDKGTTVYRQMRSDKCPDLLLDASGQAPKQLYSKNGKVVAYDKDYGLVEG